MMEYDVHTVLDMLTLVATAAVIYQLRVKLVDTYQDDQDSVKTYYVVRVPLVRPCWADDMTSECLGRPWVAADRTRSPR